MRIEALSAPAESEYGRSVRSRKRMVMGQTSRASGRSRIGANDAIRVDRSLPAE